MPNRVLVSATEGEGPWVHLGMKNPEIELVGTISSSVVVKNSNGGSHVLEITGKFILEGSWAFARAIIPRGSRVLCFMSGGSSA